jgi:hypothetical protein
MERVVLMNVQEHNMDVVPTTRLQLEDLIRRDAPSNVETQYLDVVWMGLQKPEAPMEKDVYLTVKEVYMDVVLITKLLQEVQVGKVVLTFVN